MGASFTPDNILPIIATLEDQDANEVITISVPDGSVDSISIGVTIPGWLTVSTGSASVSLKTHFIDSPFTYAVHSVEQDTETKHTDNSLLDVPCDQFTYRYERLSHGTLFFDLPVTVRGKEKDESSGAMIPFVSTKNYVIEVYANYSIGKNLLEDLIKCQQ